MLLSLSSHQVFTYTFVVLWMMTSLTVVGQQRASKKVLNRLTTLKRGQTVQAAPSPPPPRQAEGEYISFEPWNGGFNNRRMGLEIAFTAAYLYNRTLILPPLAPAVMTSGETSFADYYDLTAMRKFIKVLKYEDFLLISGGLPPADGALSDGVTADITTYCNAKHKRAIPRGYCTRSGLARQRARLLTMDFNKVIFNLDGTDGGDEDYVEYRRKRAEYDLSLDLAEAYWVHFPQNLFGLYYQIFYIKDQQRRNETWRAVRDGLVFNQNLRDKSASIVASLFGSTPFAAIHYRRGDFKGQFESAMVPPGRLLENYRTNQNSAPFVYLATDEKDANIISQVKTGLNGTVYTLVDLEAKGLLDGVPKWQNSIIELLVCTHAERFTGTKLSTFSAYITRLRGYANRRFDKQVYYTDTAYLPNETLHEAQPYSWNSPEKTTRLTDFRGMRPLWMREYPEAWEI